MNAVADPVKELQARYEAALEPFKRELQAILEDTSALRKAREEQIEPLQRRMESLEEEQAELDDGPKYDRLGDQIAQLQAQIEPLQGELERYEAIEDKLSEVLGTLDDSSFDW